MVMKPRSMAVPIVSIVALALLGCSQAADDKSVGRGWPVSVLEFDPVSMTIESPTVMPVVDLT